MLCQGSQKFTVEHLRLSCDLLSRPPEYYPDADTTKPLGPLGRMEDKLHNCIT